VRGVILAAAETIPADVVVIAVGVRPDATLAAAAGLPLGPHGGIVVDERMRTAVDGIWGGVATAARTRHLLHDGPAYIPLGTTANKQGRVAGTNVAGGAATFAGVLGTAVVKVCGLHVGRTGLGEAEGGGRGLRHP